MLYKYLEGAGTVLLFRFLRTIKTAFVLLLKSPSGRQTKKRKGRGNYNKTRMLYKYLKRARTVS